MKPRRTTQRNQALTLVEVVVILAILTVLAALLLPALAASERKAQRIHCVNNLMQIGLANRVWVGDHFNRYPMWASVTNNGTTGLLREGIMDSQLALWNFTVMSNELSSPFILHCPSDDRTTAATSFANLCNANISYFTSMDASEVYPQMILSGDDNLAIGGVPVKAGILNLPTNAPIAWTDERHRKAGNIGLADGSVQQVTQLGLQQALQQTGTNLNRIAFP
jgi:prepilin-type processing-associated H-X9-DG protein